jgi:hypothetical protein
MTSRFITVNAVAKLIGVHHCTARQWLESLSLQWVQIGKRHVYRIQDVKPRIEEIFGTA